MESFEAAWRARFGCQGAVAFPSARSGLYALLKAHGVGRADDVIVTGFTCIAVPDAVRYAGARPVYADIDARSYAMRPDEVERLLGPRSRVLVIQHTLGLSAEVERLVELAHSKGVFVIEDAALALGSNLDGRQLGSFADAAIFSFELSKTISAGWGGIVQLNASGLEEKLRGVRDAAGAAPRLLAARRLLQAGLSHFLYGPSLVRPAGYPTAALFKLRIFQLSADHGGAPGRPPENFLAARGGGHWKVLTSQLGRLDRLVERSHKISARYGQVLASHGLDAAIPSGLDRGACLIRFPLQVRERERMTGFFAERGIELGRWFDYPISDRPDGLASYNYIEGQCPVGERVAQHIVNLPLHSRMSSADAELASRTLDEYLAAYPDDRDFIAESVSRSVTAAV